MEQDSQGVLLGHIIEVFDDNVARPDAFAFGTYAQLTGDASMLYILGSNL